MLLLATFGLKRIFMDRLITLIITLAEQNSCWGQLVEISNLVLSCGIECIAKLPFGHLSRVVLSLIISCAGERLHIFSLSGQVILQASQ